jgi:hypothetical protein
MCSSETILVAVGAPWWVRLAAFAVGLALDFSSSRRCALSGPVE